MQKISNSAHPSMEIRVYPITSFTKALYNYDITSKTTSTAREILKKSKDELAKARYMLNNFKTTSINLSAFVKEVYNSKFNPNQEPLTFKGNIGLMLSTALFITLIYCSQMRKAVVKVIPTLEDVYELGESAYERDIWKGFNSLEKIFDNIFNAKSQNPFAISDGSEKKTKESRESKKSKRSRKTKETEGSEGTKESRESKKSKRSRKTKETEGSEGTKESKNSKEVKESKDFDSKKLQEPQIEIIVSVVVPDEPREDVL